MAAGCHAAAVAFISAVAFPPAMGDGAAESASWKVDGETAAWWIGGT